MLLETMNGLFILLFSIMILVIEIIIIAFIIIAKVIKIFQLAKIHANNNCDASFCVLWWP